SRSTSYDVLLGRGNPPPQVATGVTSPWFTPTTPLATNTTYFWQVVARNSGGSTPGPVWSFTTAAGTAPGPATNPSPANGATGVNPVNPTLSWTGTHATAYDDWFGIDNTPTQTIPTSPSASS